MNHLSDSVSIVDVASSPPRVVRTLLTCDEPRDIVFAVELNDALAEPVGDLFTDTIRHRVQCGRGAFDVRGFIETLQGLGFSGPWGVEILADAHRALPLDEALRASFCAAIAQFD